MNELAQPPATMSELLDLLDSAYGSSTEARKYQHHIRRVRLSEWVDLAVVYADLEKSYPGGGPNCDQAREDIKFLCNMLEYRVDEWPDDQLAEMRLTLAEARANWAECESLNAPQQGTNPTP